MLQHLFTISDIFHLLHFLYGDESAMLLHMGRDKSAEAIWSLQGVAQGCVSADAVCCVRHRQTLHAGRRSKRPCARMAAAPNCWRSALLTK